MMSFFNRELAHVAIVFAVLLLLGVGLFCSFLHFDFHKIGSPPSGGEQKGITVRELSVEMNAKWYVLVKFGLEEYKEFWNASTVIPAERLDDLRKRFDVWMAHAQSNTQPEQDL